MRETYNSDPKNHPGVVAVFKKLYYVSIPAAYRNHNEDRARYSTGDSELDTVLSKERFRTWMTINDAFELWREGAKVGIVNYDDSRLFYTAIEEHLSRWYNFMMNGFNLSSCPFEELLELDRFANTVYDKAKYTFTQESLKPFETAFNSLGINVQVGGFFGGRSKRVIFGHTYKTEEEIQLEKDPNNRIYKDREGYEEGFVKVASRYDFRLKPSSEDLRGEEVKVEVSPFSTRLRFGNDKI